MKPPDYHLWDFAGVDGLQAAIALFSPAIARIAPFQSRTVEFKQHNGSVLRLCENNFRVALSAPVPFDQAVTERGLQVWVKPYGAATLVLPVELGLQRLRQMATTKPIYTLDPFPCDRAVPARINGIAILAWYHLWQGQPRLAIQTATANVDAVQAAFSFH